MTTTITLPALLAARLQRRAAFEQRSVESLAVASIQAGLTHLPEPGAMPAAHDPSPELLDLVAQIKALRAAGLISDGVPDPAIGQPLSAAERQQLAAQVPPGESVSAIILAEREPH